MHIIDRRRDASGKSLGNRQRFIRRARALVRHAVREASKGRKITDAGRGGEITVPADGVHEPSLAAEATKAASANIFCPATRTISRAIPSSVRRPEAEGRRRQRGRQWRGRVPLRLSDEEFIDLFLEDLELPDLAKRQVMGEEKTQPRRAGYRSSGPPAMISVPRTMRNSLARRIALKRPKPQELKDLEARLKELEERADPADLDEIQAIKAELARHAKRSRDIPFIDPVDVRYRRFEQDPKPVAQAVMFCLMDVSGSMDEHLKDLAKRFYSLLYLFLSRRYRYVEVVFIRHTHEAKEVDEDTFFNSRETGGTVVSTALEEMIRVVADRFPPSKLEHLRGPGVGRRQSSHRQRKDRRPFEELHSASVPILRLHRGRQGAGGAPPRDRAAEHALARLRPDPVSANPNGDAQGSRPPRYLSCLPGTLREEKQRSISGGLMTTTTAGRPASVQGRGLGLRHACAASTTASPKSASESWGSTSTGPGSR